MCKAIATIISVIFLVVLNLCYIWEYDLFSNLKEIVIYNQDLVYLLCNLLSKGIIAVLYCRHSNIIKVWLRENCSTEHKYKNSQMYANLLIFSAVYFFYLTSLIIYHFLRLGVESHLWEDDIARAYLVVLVIGLLCYISRCFHRDKLHHCSILLITLLLGCFIPYVLFPKIHTFNIKLLFVHIGGDEMIRKLVGNLFLTISTIWQSEPFLFVSIIWYESLWIVYFRSLRFDEEFPKITKFFIFLVLLGLTVNIFVVFFYFCPAAYLTRVGGMFPTYLVWLAVLFNIVLLLR